MGREPVNLATDRSRARFVCAAVLVALAAPVAAQERDPDDRIVEELIVTATHRETALMDTPMGIGAVTGDMIKELGAQEMGEIFRMISGLNMGGEGAAQTRYTVRGVSSQQTNSVRDTAGSMVAVYLDGASLTSALGFTPVIGECVRCGESLADDEIGRFVHGAGGVVCEDCGASTGGARIGPRARAQTAGLVAGDAVPLERGAAHLRLLEDFLLFHLQMDMPLQSIRFLEPLARAGDPT